MGDETESVPEEQSDVALITHRRLLIQMAVLTVLMTILGLIIVSARFAFGIFIGGLVSFANYFWLKDMLRRLFEKVEGRGGSMIWLSVQYALRYVLLGAGLYSIFRTDAFPVIAVLVGLGSFALAVVSEGLFNIFTTFNRKEI